MSDRDFLILRHRNSETREVRVCSGTKKGIFIQYPMAGVWLLKLPENKLDKAEEWEADLFKVALEVWHARLYGFPYNGIPTLEDFIKSYPDKKVKKYDNR